jgi:hypothetical protein
LILLPTILQAIGVTVIAVGLGLIWPPAGVIAIGIGILLFGIAWEKSGK